MVVLRKPRASRTYVEHVEEDIELDDRLSADNVIHHRDINVINHDTTNDQNETLQQITDLRSIQQTSACRPTTQQTHNAAAAATIGLGPDLQKKIIR